MQCSIHNTDERVVALIKNLLEILALIQRTSTVVISRSRFLTSEVYKRSKYGDIIYTVQCREILLWPSLERLMCKPDMT